MVFIEHPLAYVRRARAAIAANFRTKRLALILPHYLNALLALALLMMVRLTGMKLGWW